MTFQPPPPPPPPGAPPPPPGGQPPGQYGPPPGGAPYGAPGGSPYGTPSAGFDPKSVNPLDWGILAAGLLAFIFSFVSFYSYTVKAKSGGVTFGSASDHVNAWHGFFGWFAVLLAIVGSAIVAVSLLAPHVTLPFSARLAGLGCYAVATLCLILALFIIPGDTSGASALGVSVDKGHGVGYWITLIAVIAGLVLSLMRFQQSGGQLPGGLNRMPNIGGHGPGGPPPPPPGGPGYGPPPGGGGYGSP
jgi:hypothetical protein